MPKPKPKQPKFKSLLFAFKQDAHRRSIVVKQGLVKWFNKVKGFGFIRPDDGTTDVFVHYSDIQGNDNYKTLLDGQHVEYEETQGDRGKKAKNVIVVPEDDK